MKNHRAIFFMLGIVCGIATFNGFAIWKHWFNGPESSFLLAALDSIAVALVFIIPSTEW